MDKLRQQIKLQNMTNATNKKNFKMCSIAAFLLALLLTIQVFNSNEYLKSLITRENVVEVAGQVATVGQEAAGQGCEYVQETLDKGKEWISSMQHQQPSGQCDSVQVELEKSRAAVKQLQGKYDSVQVELDKSRAKCDSAQVELEKSRATVKQLQGKVEELEADIDDYVINCNGDRGSGGSSTGID